MRGPIEFVPDPPNERPPGLPTNATSAAAPTTRSQTKRTVAARGTISPTQFYGLRYHGAFSPFLRAGESCPAIHFFYLCTAQCSSKRKWFLRVSTTPRASGELSCRQAIRPSQWWRGQPRMAWRGWGMCALATVNRASRAQRNPRICFVFKWACSCKKRWYLGTRHERLRKIVPAAAQKKYKQRFSWNSASWQGAPTDRHDRRAEHADSA